MVAFSCHLERKGNFFIVKRLPFYFAMRCGMICHGFLVNLARLFGWFGVPFWSLRHRLFLLYAGRVMAKVLSLFTVVYAKRLTMREEYCCTRIAYLSTTCILLQNKPF